MNIDNNGSEEEPAYDTVYGLIHRWASEVLRITPSALDKDRVLMEVAGADSVKIIRLLGTVERHFGIQMMIDDLNVARTLRELTDQVFAIKYHRRISPVQPIFGLFPSQPDRRVP
ncbi:acyl carrier protein [Mycobacteroides chelonae]